MKALLLVLLLLAASVGLVADPEGALACSCPDCDSVRDSDVIVGGRVLGWSRSSTPGPDPMAIPLDIHVTVDHVWKGSAPAQTDLFDPLSLVNLKDPTRNDVPDRFVWMGGGGACQAFTEDPTGKYIVVGFDVGGEGARRVIGLRVFFLGDGPAGERWAAALRRLEAVGTPYPPDAGNSATAEPDPGSDDWMFVSAIGAGMVLFTLLVVLGGPRRR
jgi:hypothetical protein